MQCQKKIFSFVIFSQMKNKCLLQKFTQKGFVSFTPQSSEQLLRGTHGRQECDGHPLHLPGIDILAEEKGNRYFMGEGEAAWPGGVSAGQDLHQRRGKLGEEAEAASGWHARHKKRFPPNRVSVQRS